MLLTVMLQMALAMVVVVVTSGRCCTVVRIGIVDVLIGALQIGAREEGGCGSMG